MTSWEECGDCTFHVYLETPLFVCVSGFCSMTIIGGHGDHIRQPVLECTLRRRSRPTDSVKRHASSLPSGVHFVVERAVRRREVPTTRKVGICGRRSTIVSILLTLYPVLYQRNSLCCRDWVGAYERASHVRGNAVTDSCSNDLRTRER